VQSWLADPRPAAVKSAELSWSQLQGNPYDHLCMIAHEAFHAFQRKQAPEKAGSEEALQRYPTIAVNNTVGFALEGDWLAKALRATTPSDVRQQAIYWLATRTQRRKGLSAEAISYEDRMEYLEGLAKYVEYRLLQVLEGTPSGSVMAWVQGFNGYANLKPEREALINQLLKMMHGEANVNNDPYGASPLRMRLYFSGMAIGVMLDQLDPTWKQHIFERDETLTGLATKALKATDAELAAAWKEIGNQPGYDKLKTQKTLLEKEGKAATQKILEEIKAGSRSRLIVDYSALGDAEVVLGFTPFGVLRVDDDRTVYRLVPIRAKVGSATLRQTKPTPLLHDRATKQLSCQLPEVLTAERVNSLFDGKIAKTEPSELGKIDLPGVTLNLGKATVTVEGRTIIVQLIPAK
jgi:hypothetical protein